MALGIYQKKKALIVSWRLLNRFHPNKSKWQEKEDEEFIEQLKSRGDSVRVIGGRTVVADPREIMRSDEYKTLCLGFNKANK